MNQIMDLDLKYYMNIFGKRKPVVFEYGKGVHLYDKNGNEYLDLLSGIAVNALGHGHKKLCDALKNQIDKVLHTSNYYYIENQAKLAQVIVENSCADKVMFSNSGAEANEGAIKLAKIYFYKRKLDKTEIITLENSFHGRTLTTVAATGQEKFQLPYNPLTPGFIHVPINDMESFKKAVTPKTCAVMMELVQGESGVNLVDKTYLKEVREFCNQNDILLIFDEVQTGMGRTGTLFAYEQFGVEPDIFTLAKALGNGIPIGCLAAKEFVASAFEPGDHGTTFGGNPLACCAGLVVLEELLEGGILEGSKIKGEYFMQCLNELKNDYPYLIKEVRGIGLMIAIEFYDEIAPEIYMELFENKFLLSLIGKKILRLLPPLIIKNEHIDKFIKTIRTILDMS